MIVRQFIEWVRGARSQERAEATGALARAYIYSDLSPDDRAAAEGAMLVALDDPRARLYIHCAAGVHRAPMMTLAVLCALEWEIEAAMVLIETRRPVVDFADVYVESVRHFLESRVASGPRSSD